MLLLAVEFSGQLPNLSIRNPAREQVAISVISSSDPPEYLAERTRKLLGQTSTVVFIIAHVENIGSYWAATQNIAWPRGPYESTPLISSVFFWSRRRCRRGQGRNHWGSEGPPPPQKKVDGPPQLILMKSVITVTKQTAVYETGYTIRILFCTIT